MSVRVNIDPSNVKNLSTTHNLSLFKARVGEIDLLLIRGDSGVYYFDNSGDSLEVVVIPRGLAKYIKNVTCQTRVTDQAHRQLVQLGRYVFGKTKATVERRNVNVGSGNWMLIHDISVDAPNLTALRRFMTELKAGRLTPVDSYEAKPVTNAPAALH